MTSVLFLHPSDSARSGCDVLNEKFAKALSTNRVYAQTRSLWPDGIYRMIMRGPIPKKSILFFLFVGIPSMISTIPILCRFQIISFNGFGILRDPSAIFERCVKWLGKKYVYHYQDHHLAVPFLREGVLKRLQLASAVIVPTEPLRHAIREIAPHLPVYILEEGIDVDRFRPVPTPSLEPPVVVWCGNPLNLKEIPFLFNVLRRLQSLHDFRFRIICGTYRPSLDIDFEWFPYSPKTEPSLLTGACAGLAPVMDSPYARGKGGYKVKTYLAAGVPAIASPVGHQANMVQPGCNGFLPQSEKEWEEALSTLITNRKLAFQMGVKAREDAISKYAYASIAPAWATAFDRIFNDIP